MNNTVQLTTMGKEYARAVLTKGGFLDTAVDSQDEDEEAHSVLGTELEALVTSAGMTWNQYSTCDQDLATSETLEKDWETREEEETLASLGDDESGVADDTPVIGCFKVPI